MPKRVERRGGANRGLVLAAAGLLACVGIAASIWSGLSGRRTDLERPSAAFADASGSDEARKQQLAKQFNVDPSTIKLDGTPNAQRAPAPAPAGEAPTWAPAEYVDVSAANVPRFAGAVSSAATELKNLTTTPTATAEQISKSAQLAVLAPVLGKAEGEKAWSELAGSAGAGSEESAAARERMLAGLSAVFTGAQIDVANVRVTPFKAGERRVAGDPGVGIVLGMPNAFPAASKAQEAGAPAVRVRVPVVLPDGTGKEKRVELAMVLVQEPASKAWLPTMTQILSDDPAEAMKLVKAFRDGMGSTTPIPALPKVEPKPQG
jgi:hypothetical protein